MARKKTQGFFSLGRSVAEPLAPREPVYLDIDEFESRIQRGLDLKKLQFNSYFTQIHDIFHLSDISHVLHNKIPEKMSYKGPSLNIGWSLPKDGVAVLRVSHNNIDRIPIIPADDYQTDDEGFEVGYPEFHEPCNFYTFAATYQGSVYNAHLTLESHEPRTNSPLLPDWWVSIMKSVFPKS